MKPETQEQKILACLADGRWWSSAELYRRTHSILHSRVANLRRRGFVIEHSGGGAGPENHFYRWVREQEKAA